MNHLKTFAIHEAEGTKETPDKEKDKTPKSIRVKVGDTIYDANETPIMLIFADDEQRKLVCDLILSMEDQEGVRKYAQIPDDMKEDDINKFMNIDEPTTDDEESEKSEEN